MDRRLLIALLVVLGIVLVVYIQQSPDKPVEITTTIIPETTTIPHTTTIPETTTTSIPETTTLEITTSISGECARDEDCIIAGNFNQTCAPRSSEFKDDEWKPEYRCLEETTCSCIDGRCEWKLSEEYDTCMRKLFPNYCRRDSDCIPEQCCHPSSCINKEVEPDCAGIACTEECRIGTMDCGCGKCGCMDNECIVLRNRDRSCIPVAALVL